MRGREWKAEFRQQVNGEIAVWMGLGLRVKTVEGRVSGEKRLGAPRKP